MQRPLLLAALVGLALGACRTNFQEECSPGQEQCVCAENDECLGDLICLSNLCVSPDEAETGADTMASMSAGDGDGASESSSSGDGDSSSSAEDTSSGDGDASGTGDGDATTDDGTTGDGDGDLLPLDEDWESTELPDHWMVLNPGSATLSFTGSDIRIEPDPSTVWWQASQSVLVYQLGAGDLMMTAEVRATPGDGSGPPNVGFRLGGLMMRAPEDAAENYVAIVVGGGQSELAVETKSTMNSQSTLEASAWPSAAGEFRICRVGDTFRMLARAEPSQAWTVLEDYARPDLPSSLQMGLVAYANDGVPDLRVDSDWVHFDAAGDLADCEN